MANIYEQHKAAFSQVSAYAVVKGGMRFGSIAFKFPKDGAGRLYCYFHIFGLPMFRGYAGGYGYDKKSAAVADAFSKIADFWQRNDDKDLKAAWEKDIQKISKAMEKADSGQWDTELSKRGYKLFGAV